MPRLTYSAAVTSSATKGSGSLDEDLQAAEEDLQARAERVAALNAQATAGLAGEISRVTKDISDGVARLRAATAAPRAALILVVVRLN